jgi:hypothetical protein
VVEEEKAVASGCAPAVAPLINPRNGRYFPMVTHDMSVILVSVTAGGVAVALFAAKGLLRFRPSARARIDGDVVSDAWLAERRGARKDHPST